ncbi:MAG: ABC transporter permease subunit/CPBP intramembrane protease [Gemmataceae bacterium]
MRWSIIRLIWLRELRDQLRDRRTIFTIVGLPLVLYPLISVFVFAFALQLVTTPSTIGIRYQSPKTQTFPERFPAEAGKTPSTIVSWFSAVPQAGRSNIASVIAGAALVQASEDSLEFAPLMENGQVHRLFHGPRRKSKPIFPASLPLKFVSVEGPSKRVLQEGKVDLILSASPDFMARLERGEKAVLLVQDRKNDDSSRRAKEQLDILLTRWRNHLLDVRLRRDGKPPDFAAPFVVKKLDETPQGAEVVAAEALLDLLVRTFPFMLVMWSLAGALYPAVDLCAGEKERGTMETLLITPTGRLEIVLGKFLTIWVFSAGTAIMHLVSMSLATWQLRSQLPQGAVTIPAIFWCILLVVPLGALFSAVSLAIGAYARSTKEGQYYLMPLLWVTMPLLFLTLAPGVELNPFYSMVPVTGVALLMRQLMLTSDLATVPWLYFFPVFGTIAIYSWIALRWAVRQFQSEEVLFREAERIEIGLWLRRLFREKEALPTPFLVVLCFSVLLGLRWFSERLGEEWPLWVRSTTLLLSFVAAPPMIMALVLTKRPRRSLNWYLPQVRNLLGAIFLLPLAALAVEVLQLFPPLVKLLDARQTWVRANYDEIDQGSKVIYWAYHIVGLGLLPAVCKEIAFRGFVLNGLRSRLPAWTAILLSSFLFAAYHLNVFWLGPWFLLGVVNGVLAVRSNSLLPGIVLHFGCLLLTMRDVVVPLSALVPISLLSTGIAGWLLWKSGLQPFFWRQQNPTTPIAPS